MRMRETALGRCFFLAWWMVVCKKSLFWFGVSFSLTMQSSNNPF
jgi:hypothetical protein